LSENIEVTSSASEVLTNLLSIFSFFEKRYIPK